jgi:tetratricopeptide (TPR) repeat protein
MAKGFETRGSLGPLTVSALLILLAGGTWASTAAVGNNPPSPPPTQAGDTDPVAGTAAGTPSLPPPAPARPQRDLRNEQIQELYRQALASWATAQEERACEQLMAVETAVVDDREVATRKRLLRAEEAVIHTVAANDLEVLIPIARLHFEASRHYLAQTRGFALVLTHSRGMVRDLAVLYQQQTGTASAAQVASSILTSLGELMHSAAQHASAAELFEQATKLDPSNAVASLGLAMVYEKHEQYKGAVNTLRRLLQAVPDSAEGRLRLAINLRRLDHRDEARKLLAGLLAMPSKRGGAHAERAPQPAGAAAQAASATGATAPTGAASPSGTAAPGPPAVSAETQEAARRAAERAAVDALFGITTPAGSSAAPAQAAAAGTDAGAARAAGAPAGSATGSPGASPAGALAAAATPGAPAPASLPPAAGVPAIGVETDIEWVQRLAAEELAQLDEAAGNHAEAARVLRAALEHHPASATLRIELAEVLDHAGDIRGSQAVLEKLLEQPPAADDNCRFLYNSPAAETFAVPRAIFAEGSRTRLPALAHALGLAAPAAAGAGSASGGI